jgi:hypothetical protein
MTTRSWLVGLAVAVAALGTTAPARASTFVSVGMEIRSVDDFYGPLAPHGYWVETSAYGRCWRPAYIDQGWRPYCNGHWVRCDEGWYWMSDEPWAWAPSWVCWRESGGYVGWAPMCRCSPRP